MKIRHIKAILPLIFSVTCLSSCGNDVPSKTGYYKNYDLTLTGQFLEYELQKLCFETHKVFIKYSQFNSYCSCTSSHDSIELVPSTKTSSSYKNEYFYTGKKASGYGTREHVWPCANSDGLWVHDESAGEHYVDGSKYAAGGSDLFHVRTCTTSINTARGNAKYVEFSDPEFESIRSGVKSVQDGGSYPLKIQGFETTSAGKYQYANKAEPHDKMKGDIARIITYVWIHYTDRGASLDTSVATTQTMLGNLVLTQIMGYDSVERCAQKLVEWNEKDEPSEVEIHRNDTVQKIQGNRNPFVDHPELIRQLFQDYLPA